MAVGDALGTTLEFTKPSPKPFTPLLDGPHVSIIGAGPFNVAKGQVTDDTQMAVCLGSSLLEHGRFDPADVAARYRAWVRLAFDAGNLTRQSLQAMAQGDVERAGLHVWTDSGRNNAGNGSLMRTAPIGVFFGADAEARRAASLADSALTHADPRCQLACAAFNAAIAAAIQGADRVDTLVDVASSELDAAAAVLRSTTPELLAETEPAVAALQDDLAAARMDDPELYSVTGLHLLRAQGFVRVAFRLAFWELLHAPTAAAGLIDAVNRGGDADTNGAIVGALIGAYHGAEALPAAWRTAVLKAMSEVPASPWWTTYHPRLFLPLAEGTARPASLTETAPRTTGD